MKMIPLRSKKRPGMVAKVSDEDYDAVSKHTWHPSDSGWNRWRARTSINGKQVSMHHFILDRIGTDYKDLETDHIDGDQLNNSRWNLRVVTHAENMKNFKGNHQEKWLANNRHDKGYAKFGGRETLDIQRPRLLRDEGSIRQHPERALEYHSCHIRVLERPSGSMLGDETAGSPN